MNRTATPRRGAAALLLLIAGATAPAAQTTLVSPNTQANGYFGLSAAAVGDVTGDGVTDALVSAPWETVGGLMEAGRVYLFDGATAGLVRTLVSPRPRAFAAFGSSVAGAGDLTGDGVPDLLVGCTTENTTAGAGGAAYVFDGATGALVRTLYSPNPDPQNGFGAVVAGAGDVTGDGVADVLVTSTRENGATALRSGRAHLFDGATGAHLHTLDSPGAQPSGYFGVSGAGVGDVTGDGVPDVLVGAFNEGDNSHDTGRAYLFSGASGAFLRRFASPNEQANGYFGYAVAGVGDVTGDGVPDLLVGANEEGPSGSGRTYLYNGATGALARTLLSPHGLAGGGFGSRVGSAGDLTGDGVPDFLIGSPRQAATSGVEGGEAYVYNGATGTVVRTLAPPSPQTGGNFGSTALVLGDVDGDGAADFLVTAPSESSYAGRAYLVRGTVVTATEGAPTGAGLALAVAPNPVAGAARVSYRIDRTGPVQIAVYDVTGRRVADVANADGAVGAHEVALDAAGLAPGVYVVRLTTADGTAALRMSVAR